MAGYADSSYQFKGLCCTRLETEKYSAIISPLTGCSVIRLFDKINNIEVFRYKDDVTFDTINQAREIWGLPTLYLPNRFDKGIIKTSDGIYDLPINETLFDNYIHGWVHKREHTVEKAFSDGVRAVLETSYTFDETDEMYEYFPVDFRIEYTFELSDEGGLEQRIKLTDLSPKTLPVSICTHTCLNAPMTAGGKEDTMTLSVPVEKKCELNERCLPTEKLLDLDDWDWEYKNGTKIPTGQVISNDMYTACMNSFDGKDFYGVVVTDHATGHSILNEVSPEFKFWNMWNDNGDKGYFCPEPMTAMINAVNLSLPDSVSGNAELFEGQSFTCSQRFFTV